MVRSPRASYVDRVAGVAQPADQVGDVLGARQRMRARGLGGEHADGTPDLGHRLPPDLLGVGERGQGVVDIGGAVVAGDQRLPGATHVQHGHAQRVGHEVVDLAGDPLSFGERGALGLLRAGAPLGGQRPHLPPHRAADEEPEVAGQDEQRDVRAER